MNPMPWCNSHGDGLAEARMNITWAVDELFRKTGTSPRDIDILVTACGAFNTIPSMASLVVNHYKMRSSVKSFHLGGMACSAGVIGVQLVEDLLKANPNSDALFITTEVLSTMVYPGGKPEMLAANMLFRQGAAAVLLSNKRSRVAGAKYALCHSVRVHMGGDDTSYGSMGYAEDSDGMWMPQFTAAVARGAMGAITLAVKRIAPKVLNWSQLAAGAHDMLRRRLWGEKDLPPYLPSFADCIDHFALHPGVHSMLVGFMKGLKLPKDAVLPSFAALRDYGNTSASSTYYVMAYQESLGGVRRGEKWMQISVGTGVKAGVNVWRALRDIREPHPAWEHLGGVPVTEADLPRPITRPAAEAANGAMDHATNELKSLYGN